jgi:hypothetical protein
MTETMGPMASEYHLLLPCFSSNRFVAQSSQIPVTAPVRELALQHGAISFLFRQAPSRRMTEFADERRDV